MVLSWKYKRLYSLSDIRVQYDPNLASFDWSVMYAELQKLNFQTQRPPKPAQEDIESILKEHGPFILLHLSGKIPYHSIYPLPPAGTTHAIVITGTDPHGFIRGDKNGADRCWYNNPWGTRNGSCHTTEVIKAIEDLSKQGHDPIAYLP